MNLKLFFLVSIVFILLSLSACTSADTAEEKGKLTLFTTIYPLQSFTERIGGNLVEVENIVPPGSDAHSVEMTT